MIQESGEICLPALPVHLRDITHAEEGPDILKEEGKIINVSKMLRVSMAMYQFLRHRPSSSPPMSARSSRHIPFLNNVVFVDRNEESLFEISEALKPFLGPSEVTEFFILSIILTTIQDLKAED